MEDVETIVSLLTFVIALLTLVIIVLIATIAIMLTKFNKLMDEAHVVTRNLTSATKWLSPTVVFTELVKVLRK